MKRFTSLAGLALAAACGGNYSNEDLDFQLALPEQQDLAVKLPDQAQTVADSAEYFNDTRGVVTTFNGISAAFLSLIDDVRGYPPSARQGEHRVWGPFPDGKHPGWQAQVVMDRSDAALPAMFSYAVNVRPVGAADWIALLIGSVTSNGGVRSGAGHMTFSTTAARAAGYPLDDLSDWETLTIDYQTMAYPATITLTLVSHSTGSQIAYRYQTNADGSGSMIYDFPTPQLAPFATLVEIRSRWLGNGAGRADMKVLQGLATGKGGVDCWGMDTRPTYVERDLDPARLMGNAAACLFPAP